MEAWAMNLKAVDFSWNLGRRVERCAVVRQSLGCRISAAQVEWFGFDGSLEVGVLGRTRRPSLSLGLRGFQIGAGKRKNGPGNSSSTGDEMPEENDPEETNPASDKKQFDEATGRPHSPLSDWRDFRANLVARGQVHVVDSDASTGDTASHEPSQRLGLKWAHPIPIPEPGCVLVATEKLDGVHSFERTVVLLLRSGNRDPREGPFGVVVNRPSNKKIKDIKQPNPELTNIFGECAVHFGGPLDSNMFLLTSRGSSSLQGFEQVIPEIYLGARNNLDEAIALVKKGIVSPQDVRFFSGYAGWQYDQLKHEISSGYWFVVACSSNLIGEAAADSNDLWEEILQVMGGHYLELSKKPKQQDNF